MIVILIRKGDGMKINKVIFSCEEMNESIFDKQKLKKMEIVFESDKENPVLYFECDDISIEDRSLPISNSEILKGIEKINFELANDFSLKSEYSGKRWNLIVNDKEYRGILEDPCYIIELKKILKFNAIELYAIKKITNYFRK